MACVFFQEVLNSMSKKVAVVMGSDSDLDTMRPCVKRLRSFGIETQVRIISAHRTPAAAEALAAAAKDEGFGVIIAAAGKAATWPESWPHIPPSLSSGSPSRPP